MNMTDTAKAFSKPAKPARAGMAAPHIARLTPVFTCQSGALADVLTLEAYAEWMKGLLTPIPDGRYELKGFAADDDRGIVLAFAVFHGTQTCEGGPVASTGNVVASDYVYAMEFAGGKVSHMTKIWNDGHALSQLGWA